MTITEFTNYLAQYDTNHDNCISRDELRQAIRKNGGRFASWKGSRGVKSADTNGNGLIDKHEMPKLVAFAEKELSIRIVAY
ncbi:Calcium-binding EF-hand [Cynara cardunculus var. scolymus]|uniref:Calcium-binding EF-hand n=1 Tax=Cynara cardunculus var. scolymus TaxID=59895 RepID=A0A103XYR3_CYNCS|nr:Calcium-binding EF-hand [Cynara cardunculus var. scolymus]